MNFWVVKSKYNEAKEEGWHWRFYLYEDCEGYDWGGENSIRSKESQKYIREGVRKGDIVVCSQRGEGILGFTTLTGDGKDDPPGSGIYNSLPIPSSTEAFVLDPILPIPKLKETGCNPKCFMPGRMGTVSPLGKEEFGGIVDAIIKYSPEIAEDMTNWLKRQGFEHQGEVQRPEGSVEYRIVKAEQTVASIPGEMLTVDDCILMLFFLYQVGLSDGYFSPMEVRYFHKCIPPTMFDGVIKRWNEIEKLWQTMSDDEGIKYYEDGCQKAMSMKETWKAKVINNMIQMAKSDRRVYQEELSIIAEIADKIGAREECRKQLLKEFDWDSYGVAGAKPEPKQRNAIDKFATEKKRGEDLNKGFVVSNKREQGMKPSGIAVAGTLHENGLKKESPFGGINELLDRIRVAEEFEYYEKYQTHEGLQKLRTFFSELFQQDQQKSDASYIKESLKWGVEVQKSSRPDVIETAGDCLKLFGQSNHKFRIFAMQKMPPGFPDITNEDAFSMVEDGSLIILLVKNILDAFAPSEIKFVIGHEVGHFLLKHNQMKEDLRLNLVRRLLRDEKDSEVETSEEEEKVREQLLKDKEVRELQMLTYLLFQLQELSADRLGLIGSLDFRSAVGALAKLHGGSIGGPFDIEQYIAQFEKTLPLDGVEDILGVTHPHGPNRAKALRIFYESDVFMNFVGKQGGKPISKIKIIPEIVPFPKLVEEDISSIHPMKMEDYILELFFYNEVGGIDGKLTAKELDMMKKSIPTALRNNVLQEWDNVTKSWSSKTSDDMAKLVEQYYTDAGKRDSRWKTKLIKRLIRVVKADRRVYEEELHKVSAIAQKIDGRKECSRQFLKEFGYDPFAQT